MSIDDRYLYERNFVTSDTIMRIDEVPTSLFVIGGGFIAAELGHVFGAFGAEVTVAQRGPRLLRAEDEQVSARFTELARRRCTVLLDTAVTAVVHGHLVTDDAYRTSVPGVWAFGDVANHFQLKHMANAEERVVLHNLTHPDTLRRLPHHLSPHAVFSDPQVESVGLTEQEARRLGIDYTTAVKPYADTAYGWALEDTTSFVKLIADPHARTLLGAHIIGPQAAVLLQPLLQAMMLGQTVDQLAHHVLYVHPALSEVLEQTLLEL